jgi:hypothetical protein
MADVTKLVDELSSLTLRESQILRKKWPPPEVFSGRY